MGLSKPKRCKKILIFQASGVTKYMMDRVMEKTELYAAFVLSTQGNATLASIDPSPALVSISIFLTIPFLYLQVL